MERSRMTDTVTCPVCQNVHGGTCRISPATLASSGFECDVCGSFRLSHSLYSGALDPEDSTLTPLQRAALSHRLREAQQTGTAPLVTNYWLETFLENPRLPSPAIQALNAIRFIGDRVSTTGEKIPNLQPYLYAVIGAPNPTMAGELVLQLKARRLIDGHERKSGSDYSTDLLQVNLTLDGWERYEAEKQGKIAGNYGFIAMKFGDDVLEPFVADVIKPCLKDGIGYELFDIRDVARAGIIDNIMRAQIRDSAFVIVDLTHDNSGAYWEAGYAEGLGKPVIYICEKNKFEEAKTHFDTNHCTTVTWTADDTDGFKEQLVATLRRSLNIFPTN